MLAARIMSAVVGIVVGFLIASGAAAAPTGQSLTARIGVPAGGGSVASPHYPVLTCGGHTGACDSRTENGISLDWAPTTTDDVYFRGWFTRTNTSLSSSYLRGQPFTIQSGPNVCDEGAFWIIEQHSSSLRAVVRWTHLTMSSLSAINIPVSSSGATYTRKVGDMSSDFGCPWTGEHVHEWHQLDQEWDSTPNVTEFYNDPRYPNGDYCLWDHDASDCTPYQNNLFDNWTRLFFWNEGT